ncbi:unnamed protein product [Amoebophrya sp. A25]|nr:unnamed protein product [Amoebophrya sp. A25]|eukprot:GSA25T00026546001.1
MPAATQSLPAFASAKYLGQQQDQVGWKPHTGELLHDAAIQELADSLKTEEDALAAEDPDGKRKYELELFKIVREGLNGDAFKSQSSKAPVSKEAESFEKFMDHFSDALQSNTNAREWADGLCKDWLQTLVLSSLKARSGAAIGRTCTSTTAEDQVTEAEHKVASFFEDLAQGNFIRRSALAEFGRAEALVNALLDEKKASRANSGATSTSNITTRRTREDLIIPNAALYRKGGSSTASHITPASSSTSSSSSTTKINSTNSSKDHQVEAVAVASQGSSGAGRKDRKVGGGLSSSSNTTSPRTTTEGAIPPTATAKKANGTTTSSTSGEASPDHQSHQQEFDFGDVLEQHGVRRIGLNSSQLSLLKDFLHPSKDLKTVAQQAVRNIAASHYLDRLEAGEKNFVSCDSPPSRLQQSSWSGATTGRNDLDPAASSPDRPVDSATASSSTNINKNTTTAGPASSSSGGGKGNKTSPSSYYRAITPVKNMPDSTEGRVAVLQKYLKQRARKLLAAQESCSKSSGPNNTFTPSNVNGDLSSTGRTQPPPSLPPPLPPPPSFAASSAGTTPIKLNPPPTTPVKQPISSAEVQELQQQVAKEALEVVVAHGVFHHLGKTLRTATTEARRKNAREKQGRQTRMKRGPLSAGCSPTPSCGDLLESVASSPQNLFRCDSFHSNDSSNRDSALALAESAALLELDPLLVVRQRAEVTQVAALKDAGDGSSSGGIGQGGNINHGTSTTASSSNHNQQSGGSAGCKGGSSGQLVNNKNETMKDNSNLEFEELQNSVRLFASVLSNAQSGPLCMRNGSKETSNSKQDHQSKNHDASGGSDRNNNDRNNNDRNKGPHTPAELRQKMEALLSSNKSTGFSLQTTVLDHLNARAAQEQHPGKAGSGGGKGNVDNGPHGGVKPLPILANGKGIRAALGSRYESAQDRVFALAGKSGAKIQQDAGPHGTHDVPPGLSCDFSANTYVVVEENAGSRTPIKSAGSRTLSATSTSSKSSTNKKINLTGGETLTASCTAKTTTNKSSGGSKSAVQVVGDTSVSRMPAVPATPPPPPHMLPPDAETPTSGPPHTPTPGSGSNLPAAFPPTSALPPLPPPLLPPLPRFDAEGAVEVDGAGSPLPPALPPVVLTDQDPPPALGTPTPKQQKLGEQVTSTPVPVTEHERLRESSAPLLAVCQPTLSAAIYTNEN